MEELSTKPCNGSIMRNFDLNETLKNDDEAKELTNIFSLFVGNAFIV